MRFSKKRIPRLFFPCNSLNHKRIRVMQFFGKCTSRKKTSCVAEMKLIPKNVSLCMYFFWLECNPLSTWVVPRFYLCIIRSFEKGLADGGGLARGDPSHARDSGLFSAPFFLSPLWEGGQNSGDLFWLYSGPWYPPTPFRNFWDYCRVRNYFRIISKRPCPVIFYGK